MWWVHGVWVEGGRGPCHAAVRRCAASPQLPPSPSAPYHNPPLTPHCAVGVVVMIERPCQPLRLQDQLRRAQGCCHTRAPIILSILISTLVNLTLKCHSSSSSSSAQLPCHHDIDAMNVLDATHLFDSAVRHTSLEQRGTERMDEVRNTGCQPLGRQFD